MQYTTHYKECEISIYRHVFGVKVHLPKQCWNNRERFLLCLWVQAVDQMVVTATETLQVDVKLTQFLRSLQCWFYMYSCSHLQCAKQMNRWMSQTDG